MWFKKKQTNQSNSQPSNARRKGDMRSELGLSGEDAPSGARACTPSATRRIEQKLSAVYDEEVQLHDLKVRARRRLIGALVLLGAAFVILPWVFDGQRKETAAQVAVSIPDKNIQFVEREKSESDRRKFARSRGQCGELRIKRRPMVKQRMQSQAIIRLPLRAQRLLQRLQPPPQPHLQNQRTPNKPYLLRRQRRLPSQRKQRNNMRYILAWSVTKKSWTAAWWRDCVLRVYSLNCAR